MPAISYPMKLFWNFHFTILTRLFVFVLHILHDFYFCNNTGQLSFCNSVNDATFFFYEKNKEIKQSSVREPWHRSWEIFQLSQQTALRNYIELIFSSFIRHTFRMAKKFNIKISRRVTEVANSAKKYAVILKTDFIASNVYTHWWKRICG